jgi:hypothetical protein
VACLRIIERRNLPEDTDLLDRVDAHSRVLVAKLHAFRKSLNPTKNKISEPAAEYSIDREA